MIVTSPMCTYDSTIIKFPQDLHLSETCHSGLENTLLIFSPFQCQKPIEQLTHFYFFPFKQDQLFEQMALCWNSVRGLVLVLSWIVGDPPAAFHVVSPSWPSQADPLAGWQELPAAAHLYHAPSPQTARTLPPPADCTEGPFITGPTEGAVSVRSQPNRRVWGSKLQQQEQDGPAQTCRALWLPGEPPRPVYPCHAIFQGWPEHLIIKVFVAQCIGSLCF